MKKFSVGGRRDYKGVKFLHEKTSRAQQTEFISKGRVSEYSKELRDKRLKEIEEQKSKGFVTDSCWKLMFGFSSDNFYVHHKNQNFKYENKFGYYRGTHETIDVR